MRYFNLKVALSALQTSMLPNPLFLSRRTAFDGSSEPNSTDSPTRINCCFDEGRCIFAMIFRLSLDPLMSAFRSLDMGLGVMLAAFHLTTSAAGKHHRLRGRSRFRGPQNAEQILSPDFAQVFLRIAAFQKRTRHVEAFSGRVPAVDAATAVEIAREPHMVDARDLNGVVKMVKELVECHIGEFIAQTGPLAGILLKRCRACSRKIRAGQKAKSFAQCADGGGSSSSPRAFSWTAVTVECDAMIGERDSSIASMLDCFPTWLISTMIPLSFSAAISSRPRSLNPGSSGASSYSGRGLELPLNWLCPKCVSET